MDNAIIVNALEFPDAISLAEIFVKRGCKVKIEQTSVGLIGIYYKVTIEGENGKEKEDGRT